MIASGNKGKIKEIKKFFQNLEIDIIGLDSFPGLSNIKEDGDSFIENALKKARVRAEETGMLTLADDSGLEVEYLNGGPGIYSARYAGENASDEDNNKKLIRSLQGLPMEKRKARFKSVLALVDPEEGSEVTVEGICPGYIILKPRGRNGFGYDPIFYIPEYEKTMAELPIEIKNRISHRARALKKMYSVINDRYM